MRTITWGWRCVGVVFVVVGLWLAAQGGLIGWLAALIALISAKAISDRWLIPSQLRSSASELAGRRSRFELWIWLGAPVGALLSQFAREIPVLDRVLLPTSVFGALVLGFFCIYTSYKENVMAAALEVKRARAARREAARPRPPPAR